MERFLKFLPKPEQLQQNPWFRWLGPRVFQPRVWHISRRGLAAGLAVGMFFGLLIPIAQAPVSAAAAVLLRANLPAAVVGTLVTNPLTFGPIYYGAWCLGSLLLGQGAGAVPMDVPSWPDGSVSVEVWWPWFIDWLSGVGKPLVLGLAVLATLLGVLTYYAVSLFWIIRVRRKRISRIGVGR